MLWRNPVPQNGTPAAKPIYPTFGVLRCNLCFTQQKNCGAIGTAVFESITDFSCVTRLADKNRLAGDFYASAGASSVFTGASATSSLAAFAALREAFFDVFAAGSSALFSSATSLITAISAPSPRRGPSW